MRIRICCPSYESLLTPGQVVADHIIASATSENSENLKKMKVKGFDAAILSFCIMTVYS